MAQMGYPTYKCFLYIKTCYVNFINILKIKKVIFKIYLNLSW